MKITSIKSQLQIAFAVLLTGCFLPVTVWAQSGTQGSGSSNRNSVGAQGSDSRASNPFQGGSGDKFQLPARPGEDGGFELPGIDPLQGSGTKQGGSGFDFIQRATVNEKYAGWRQASDGFDGNRLDDSLRGNWVMLDQAGTLSGLVYGIQGADLGGLNIYLLNNGREVKSVSPKEDGTFVIANVRPGAYGMIGWGENAFFAFGLNVIEYNTAADIETPTELKITATQNETTINTDWIKFFAQDVKFPVYGRYSAGETDQDPARLYGFRGQSTNLPDSKPQTAISSHQVIPASDGRVIGRVHQMSTRHGRPVDLRNTRILLLKDDDVYAAVTSDSYGVFEFPEIPGGEYSCVAVGQDGLGCIGIFLADTPTSDVSVIDDEEDEDSGEDEDDEFGFGNEESQPEFTPISLTMIPSESTGWLNNLAIESAYQRIITRPMPPEQPEPPAPMMRRRQDCPGPGSLRPGGYRPGPRRRIPTEERFFQRLNQKVDDLFTRNDQEFLDSVPQPQVPRN